MSELLETLWTDAAGEAIIHGCTKPWPNDIKWVRADLSPTTAQIMADPRVAALIEAADALVSDYMTSITHHPDHNLVRLEHFNALCAARAAIKEPKA